MTNESEHFEKVEAAAKYLNENGMTFNELIIHRMRELHMLKVFVTKISDLSTLSTRVCYELRDEAKKLLQEINE